VQHAFNLNGPLVVGDDIDGRHNWGFTGTENFVVFRRENAGAGGTTTLELRRGGVAIASATFTPAEGANVQKTVALAGAFIATTQYSFHVTTVETASGIGVNQLPADASAALDVTRTA